MSASSCESRGGWTEASYDVKVRGTTYLWGSSGLTIDLSFDKPLLLHVHNDLFGAAIDLGTRTASGNQTVIGSLQPGEFVSIPVSGFSGVFASCDTESLVGCLVKSG